MFGFAVNTHAQVILNADGPGNTYELINSVLAPGYNVIEAPDQIGVSSNSSNGTHNAFGRHIEEVFDADLNKYVFKFYSHLIEDNDVSTLSTDRQRVEIKTFASSPANLKGTIGEIVQYKWRFKIPVGWQPSSGFTHIHQVKAVGGDDSNPIFSLTLRKGTPNKLEMIYVLDQNSSSDKKQVINLSAFEGIWVEATETITVGTNGTYSINIKRVSDGLSVLSYSNNNIQTIRPTNTFIRPKWGIYRSIATPGDLKDEVLYFSDISIQELNTLPANLVSFKAEKQLNQIQLKWQTASEKNSAYFEIERSEDGKNFITLAKKYSKGNENIITNYFYNDTDPINGVNYYRLKQVDNNGKEKLSEMISINLLIKELSLGLTLSLTLSDINLMLYSSQISSGEFVIYNISGQKVYQKQLALNKGENEFLIPFSAAKSEMYIAVFKGLNEQVSKKFMK